MNKLINVIFNDLKKDKSIYISLIFVLVIALLFGTFFITILTDTDKTTIINYIKNYIENINTNNLLNNLINTNITGILIWIIGFSIIGIPLIICILFYKCFSLAFTVSSLIYTYKVKGILISIVYIFPNLILNLLVYFILTYYSFKLCITLLNNLINKVEIKNILIKKYFIILLISIILLTMSSLYETYIIPLIIKLIV